MSGDPNARYNWLRSRPSRSIILVVAQINGWRLLDKLFLTLVGAAGVSWLWSRSSLRGLRIERESAHRPRAGRAEIHERLRVENLTR